MTADGFQRARELFEGAGLAAPPVPEALLSKFSERDDWLFATRDVNPMAMYMFHHYPAEVVVRPVENYVAVAHSGHGIASWAISYHLVYGQIALFGQTIWGAIDDDDEDHERASARVRAMFERCAELIQASEKPAYPFPQPPTRLIVMESDFRGVSICQWLDAPVGGSENEEGLQWLNDTPQYSEAIRDATALVQGRTLMPREPNADPRFIRFVRPQTEIDHQQLLFTLPVGSLFLGELGGRPCTFVTERSMVNWLGDETDPPLELPPDAALVYRYTDASTRDEYLTERGWDRLVDGYLHEELWELYRENAPREPSRHDFEIAYVDALSAIRNLPCKGCGTVAWPVITKPEEGSAVWWDDPGPDFSCRACGRFLADPLAYPAIRKPTQDYPFEGVVDRSQHSGEDP